MSKETLKIEALETQIKFLKKLSFTIERQEKIDNLKEEKIELKYSHLVI